jgi:hypothetical protein
LRSFAQKVRHANVTRREKRSGMLPYEDGLARLRACNIAMALLLVASLVPVLIGA